MAKKYPVISPNLPIKRVWLPLSIIMWIGALFMRTLAGAKIVKRNKLPKPPYLILGTHASMMDFYTEISLTFPHQPYWVSTVEEFIYRYFLFRRMGVLAKRKFSNDPKSALTYLEILQKRKKILIIYPEARYSLVGENERIDKSLGKFVKKANVPVVIVKGHGNYLQCPQWSDRKLRKFHPIVNEVETVINKYDLEIMDADEIQKKIEENFYISEDEWMQKKNIKIKYPNRAKGIHQILYKCPHCGTEFEMSSEGHTLRCNHCGKEYDYLENGQLKCLNGETIFDYPSKWYKWEKECCKQDVLNGNYHFEDEVRVEKLMGAKIGFVPLEGKYQLIHDIKGGLTCKGIDNDFYLNRTSMHSFGLHIEYNYLNKRGTFIEISDNDDTYFIYPKNKPLEVTKMHFAVEHIYDMLKGQMKEEK